MTKPRAPMTIGQALDRIAGQLPEGWEQMRQVVGAKNTSTVRAWGDPDKNRPLPLPAAIALDIAFQRAGGEGLPLFETYSLQVEVARHAAFADEIELANRVCILLRESSEAHEAMVRATLPSADHRTRMDAIKQLQDVVREATGAIAVLAPGEPPDTS